MNSIVLFFKIQNRLTKGGIRPTAEVENEGVDLPEMGVLAYPTFYGSSPHVERCTATATGMLLPVLGSIAVVRPVTGPCTVRSTWMV